MSLRLVVTDEGIVLNVPKGISIKNCDDEACDTIIVYNNDCDVKHPNCICDRDYVICLIHKAVEYRCITCDSPCGMIKCKDPSCKLLLCTECSDMGRTHCENHREHGG